MLRRHEDDTFFQRAERLWMNLRAEGMITIGGFHGGGGETEGFSEIEVAPLHVRRKGDALYRHFFECEAEREPYYTIQAWVQGVYITIEIHQAGLSIDNEEAEVIVEDFLTTHGT